MSTSKRIAAVLRVRQIQERSARGVLAVNRRAHRDAATAEVRTWTQLDAHVAGLVGAPLDPNRVGEHRIVVESGVLAAGSQRTTTESAAIAADAAMSEWTIAARRVEGMERLTERMASHEAEEQQRLAANEIDDLVLARFGRELGELA